MNTIIIGAGVVGLAIARRLALCGREVLVLEAETSCGSVTSARNSGVIHAGIYYRPDSLKTRLCIEGRQKLYAYAEARGIPHKNCGKLVVATDEAQIKTLLDLQKNAAASGVDVRQITAEEAHALEPEVFCTAALHVSVTGIIDVPAYILALEGDAEEAGAMIALKSRVVSGEVTADGFTLDIMGDAPSQISCDTLINAAGLGAQNVARQIRGIDPATIPPQVLAKGNYFSVSGKQPFSMLVYPLPVLGSIGLHALCDIAGQVRFGPDVEWVDTIDYQVDPKRASLAEDAVRRYWPGLPAGGLRPDYCGIRPKLAKASQYETDFLIQGPKTHGIGNLIQLYGIESPGLTSSLAIGDYVAALLEKSP